VSVKIMLHKHLWQRLPRNARRFALLQFSDLLAPKPSVNMKGALPIIVVGAFQTTTGLGASARLCYDALKRVGVPVFSIDVTAALMQHVDMLDSTYDDGRHIEGPGTLLFVVNAPLMPLAMLSLRRRVITGKRIVGYWAWELPAIPQEWTVGVRYVHEIWVPSAFVAAAVKPIADGREVRIVPYPVPLLVPDDVPTADLIERPFTVLTVFNVASSITRKNPMAAITAFRQAFGDDAQARLIVKTINISTFPESRAILTSACAGARNIEIIDTKFNTNAMSELYLKADVLISMHRSEGFGLSLAEAMLHGKVVVATDWSGNKDFLTSENGVPVPFCLVPAKDKQGTYHHPELHWAEPDIVFAAQALQRLRNDQRYRLYLGKSAHQFARETWSSSSFAKQTQILLKLK
jgi:glycosyltransferase involved in cell wall biosynthesis